MIENPGYSMIDVTVGVKPVPVTYDPVTCRYSDGTWNVGAMTHHRRIKMIRHIRESEKKGHRIKGNFMPKWH